MNENWEDARIPGTGAGGDVPAAEASSDGRKRYSREALISLGPHHNARVPGMEGWQGLLLEIRLDEAKVFEVPVFESQYSMGRGGGGGGRDRRDDRGGPRGGPGGGGGDDWGGARRGGGGGGGGPGYLQVRTCSFG